MEKGNIRSSEWDNRESEADVPEQPIASLPEAGRWAGLIDALQKIQRIQRISQLDYRVEMKKIQEKNMV